MKPRKRKEEDEAAKMDDKTRGIMKGMRKNGKRKHLQGQWGAVGARVVFAVSDEGGGDGGHGLRRQGPATALPAGKVLKVGVRGQSAGTVL